MSDTPNRLDSLSRRSTPASASNSAAKPSLKFRPKIVARRTKEERDADAPIVKEEPRSHSLRGSMRGRGSFRGRGRANYAGTHLVSSGPLSSGHVAMQSKFANSDRIFSASPTPEFISSLKLKSESTSREDANASDDEADPTKINMNKEYRFEETETYLFPVRPERVDTETKEAFGSRTETPEPEMVKSSTTSPEPESVKNEPRELSITEIENARKVVASADVELSEDQGLLQDHLDIARALKSLNIRKDTEDDIDMDNKASSQRYILFQLPKILPEFHSSEPVLQAEEEQEEQEVKPEAEPEIKPENADATADKTTEPVEVKEEKPKLIPNNSGQVGKLRIHKSGKITMKLGNIVMNVSKGANTNFLQDAVLIDLNEEERNAYLLGHINDKILVTPRV